MPALSSSKPADVWVQCPHCGVSCIYGASNPYRPFCSEHCKKIDFGAWASEAYQVEDSSHGGTDAQKSYGAVEDAD